MGRGQEHERCQDRLGGGRPPTCGYGVGMEGAWDECGKKDPSWGSDVEDERGRELRVSVGEMVP